MAIAGITLGLAAADAGPSLKSTTRKNAFNCSTCARKLVSKALYYDIRIRIMIQARKTVPLKRHPRLPYEANYGFAGEGRVGIT